MSPSKYDSIIRLARRESARAGHFYVGVEHLFIALTRLEGGVTTGTLAEQKIAPRFVRYMIRQEVGQGDNRRFWPGYRDTPRLQTVIQIARQLAGARGAEELEERDLLLAVLQEGDSLPCRVLNGLNVDLGQLEASAANWSAEMRVNVIPVSLITEEGIVLTPDDKLILQQMFRDYDHVVIQSQLDQGYTPAKVFVAAPFQPDGRAIAPVVVKLDDRQSIIHEKERYDSFVQDILPPATARIVDNPVLPERIKYGGLKYTFIRNANAQEPVDLADFTAVNGPEALAKLLLESLYPVFGETWWSQNKPYQFPVWQEYEMVLPAALVLEAGEDLSAPRRRLSPLGQWSRRGRFVSNEVVAVEGFTVGDFYPDRQAIQLVAGAGSEAQHRSGKIEVRGLDKAFMSKLYRGALVERVVGRVISTRDDLLYRQIAALEPDFDFSSDRLSGGAAFPQQLPNPLFRYANLLHRHIAGSVSPIHGDLHLHNILVGPGGNAWLIDFAQTREGHTLFDWAVLEVNLLTTVVAPAIETDDWHDIWAVIGLLVGIGQKGLAPVGPSPVERALYPVAAVRNIAYDCLADKTDWREYYVALSLCALRGLRWPHTLTLRARRLLFLVSALAMSATAVKDGTITASGNEVDQTDYNLDVTGVISDPEFQAGGLSSPAVDRQDPSWGMFALTDAMKEPPVQFSAYYMADVNPGAWTTLNAYVYSASAEGDVLDDARQYTADTPDEGFSTAGTRPASSGGGAELMVVPNLPGFEFDPVSDKAQFQDGWLRFDFRMRATGVEPYQEQQGVLTFYLEGIVVGDVSFTVTVDPGGKGQRVSIGPVNPYQSIYCSYSAADAGVAQRVEYVAQVLDSDFMQNVEQLRSNSRHGELLTMIDRAEVFQLFWSDQAAASSLVAQEWQRALQQSKDKFVRPVFWDQEMPTPPGALMRIPFNFLPELAD